MKVLLINTYSGFGSTGSICVDIANFLNLQGHECYIAYGQGVSTYKNSFKIGSNLQNHLHNIGSRVLGKQGYFTKKGTEELVHFIHKYGPDVIHLHNLHGNYLHLETLFAFLISYKGKVIQTLHDCWAFTGKCSHYTDVSCYKWESECIKCPLVKSYPPSLFFDRSNVMFRDKIRYYEQIDSLVIHPVSKWLEGEVKRSFFKNRKIKMVYNWVDQSIFKKIDTFENYSKLLNKDIFTIILVNAHWKPNTVRWDDLIKLANELNNEFKLIVVGKNNHKDLLPKNCICIDYVDGKDKLAELYNIADTYVHLSTEDTFGKVIAEAMSCGTPAIVYNSTACGEIVGNGCGYVVKSRNIIEIIKALNNIKKNNKFFYSKNCINYVKNNFSKMENIEKIIKLYS